MPQSTFRETQEVPAGGQIVNAMAGSVFEFLPGPSLVSVSLTTVAGGEVLADVQFGSQIMCQSARVATEAAAGQGPTREIGRLVEAAGLGGDRIQIRLREVAAAPAATDVTIQVVQTTV